MDLQEALKQTLQSHIFEITYRDKWRHTWRLSLSFYHHFFMATWYRHTFMEEDLQELLNDINGRRYVKP
jgi:hypothetical protein